jgi:hypothetical protein
VCAYQVVKKQVCCVEDWLDSVEMPAARRYNGILTSGILDMGRKEQS